MYIVMDFKIRDPQQQRQNASINVRSISINQFLNRINCIQLAESLCENTGTCGVDLL